MRTIVMTGGTSGIGEVAARKVLATPDTRLLVGTRGRAPTGAESVPLDLTRLADVRSFVDGVNDRLGTSEIDALVLNAGENQPNGDGRTSDGFETSFVVNYLAHYFLLRLLLPRLADGAVVSLTTSGTHDPEENTMLPPPRHADAALLAYPERDPERDAEPRVAAGRAYSAANLCTILAVRALALQPEMVAKNVTVLAYDPGPTPGTGLLRNAPAAANVAWRVFGGLLRRMVRRFNSKEAGGAHLGAIALGRVDPPAGRYYAAVRRDALTWIEPSKLARDDKVRDVLWRDSASLVGLQP